MQIYYSIGVEEMKGKKSKTALVATILGIDYAIFALSYWFGGGNEYGADSAANVGAGLATAIVMPHNIAAILGALMNTIG